MRGKKACSNHNNHLHYLFDIPSEAKSTMQPEQLPKLLLAKPEEVQQRGLSLHTYPEDHQTFGMYMYLVIDASNGISAMYPFSTGYLRGVDVIGETSLMVTNEAQSFYWRGYGLKLHIPQGALPKSESMCTINIKVGISGHFQIHPSHTLASAVYWLYSTVKKFSKFFTLEVQHCSKRSPSSRLSFIMAKCSQKELPYTFEPLQGGIFSLGSSYGSMRLDHFSGFAIVQEGSQDPLQYCAKLYYWGARVNRGVGFVIRKNLETVLTVSKLIMSILAIYRYPKNTSSLCRQPQSTYIPPNQLLLWVLMRSLSLMLNMMESL